MDSLNIMILRLGHRLPRDERISTHVALVGRAFGADGMIYTGQHDSGLESSVSRIAERWGGKFEISYEKNYRKTINKMKESGFVIIHLTMYGIPLPEKINEIKSKISGNGNKTKKILIIVGSEQVPGDVYRLADFNIAITNQPHSEVAALAVFLNEIYGGKALERKFDEKFKGRIKINPSERGKDIASG